MAVGTVIVWDVVGDLGTFLVFSCSLEGSRICALSVNVESISHFSMSIDGFMSSLATQNYRPVTKSIEGCSLPSRRGRVVPYSI